MRQIIPYKTLSGALKALDNGGRFYNVFTKAGDDTISDSELCKAAGVISGMDQAFLFFSLALSRLSADNQKIILSRLSPGLRGHYMNSGPVSVEIDSFDQLVKPAMPVVVEGYPRFLEDRSEFSGFIMIPVMAGGVMTFMMIPIMDQYDVYELYSNSQLKGPKTVIATVRGSKRLKPARTIFGGVAKELKFKPKSKRQHRYFVETSYYIRCP